MGPKVNREEKYVVYKVKLKTESKHTWADCSTVAWACLGRAVVLARAGQGGAGARFARWVGRPASGVVERKLASQGPPGPACCLLNFPKSRDGDCDVPLLTCFVSRIITQHQLLLFFFAEHIMWKYSAACAYGPGPCSWYTYVLFGSRTKRNVNDNDNDSHLIISGNKFK